MEISDRLIISKPLYINDSSSNCGYCKHSKNNDYDYFPTDSWYQLHKSHIKDLEINNCTLGLQVELFPVEIYDGLCNLGFRRSGNFLYKADMLRNCCRLYTIRTTPKQCKISKEFKSCISRFKKRITPSSESSLSPSGTPLATGGKGKKQQPYDFVNEIISAELSSKNFYTRFEPAIYTSEKYQLFVKYQEKVHNDHNNSVKSFKKFLCESPFPEDVVIGTPEEWYELNNWKNLPPHSKIQRVGPVHECYYHEGKLIALAVTDFLPSGISSVYFIWDPEYAKWSLGKLSALRELSLLSKINRDYYYLGYYIEDCPKMKYKRKYGGDILDVCNNQYVPLDELENFLEHGKFFVLSNENKKKEDDDEYYEEVNELAPLSELPLDDTQKFSPNKPLKNIVERIYGERGGAVQSANDAVDKLTDLGIEYTPQIFNDLYKLKPLPGTEPPTDEEHYEEDDGDISGYTNEIYHLPNVVPGLLPLWQILQIVESGEINRLNNKLMLYNTRTGQIRLVVDFQLESKRTKRVICNVIRMIGLKNTAKSLIII